MQKKDWHALPVEQAIDAVDAVDAGRDGLRPSTFRSGSRSSAPTDFGPNRLRPPHRRGPFMRFAAQLHNLALVSVGLLIVIQLLFTYAWPVQMLSGTAALDAWAWLRILGFGLLVFVIVEGEKAVHRSMERGPS